MRRAAALAAALVWAASLTAPAAAQDGAVEAVEAYMAATTAQDWRGVAERVDPDDLAKMLPFVQMMGEMALDADDLTDVTPPPEDALGAFAWFMETMTAQVPMIAEMMGAASGDVLGSVAETDSLVHVVMRTRTDMMGTDVSQVTAVSVRQRPGQPGQAAGGRWFVKLNGQVDALAAMSSMAEAFGDLESDEAPHPRTRAPKSGRDE